MKVNLSTSNSIWGRLIERLLLKRRRRHALVEIDELVAEIAKTSVTWEFQREERKAVRRSVEALRRDAARAKSSTQLRTVVSRARNHVLEMRRKFEHDVAHLEVQRREAEDIGRSQQRELQTDLRSQF